MEAQLCCTWQEDEGQGEAGREELAFEVEQKGHENIAGLKKSDRFQIPSDVKKVPAAFFPKKEIKELC